MKFMVEIKVTPASIWLDGSPNLLGYLERYLPHENDPAANVHEILWRRISNKEPHVQILSVRRSE